MGGWAPYSSTAGMLISSMKIATRFPGGALNAILDFSSFSSIDCWTLPEEVCAEKLTVIPTSGSLPSLPSSFTLPRIYMVFMIVTDFPTPV